MFRYDNYTSCKKSQQHIEKKLGNYANKLNSKNSNKKKDLEEKAAEWNNGLEAGEFTTEVPKNIPVFSNL